MYGYNFYFSDNGDVMTFPITPSEVSINVGSNNKVINLINGGDINLLKSPSLIEIEFDARFPMRKYPYARDYQSFDTYYSKIKDLKANKKPFMFYITRSTPNKARTWDTELQVVIEEFKIKEDANEGDDVIVSFKLKQYKTYGVKTVTNGVIGGNSRDSGSQATTNQPYTIQRVIHSLQLPRSFMAMAHFIQRYTNTTRM